MKRSYPLTVDRLEDRCVPASIQNTTDSSPDMKVTDPNQNLQTPAIIWNTPSDIVYGTPLDGSELNASANVPGTFSYSPDIGAVLSAGSSQLLSVSFTPDDTADYSSATQTVSINVNQATPVISWSNPADIPYGTPLDGSELNATADVSGSYSYSAGPGTILNAGSSQPLSVTFTPDDATDYTSATQTVYLNVNQATPVISWSNPADINYGTPLDGSELNATANVSGSFSYSSGTGTVLSAGSSQPLSVVFTPDDATDYTSATQTVYLNVNQATPVVSWSTPSDITYGTSLDGNELNATASVSGTFTYTPAAGTVMTIGSNQTLSVTFTPDDATDYAPVTQTVSINVNAPPPMTLLTSNPSVVMVISLQPVDAAGDLPTQDPSTLAETIMPTSDPTVVAVVAWQTTDPSLLNGTNSQLASAWSTVAQVSIPTADPNVTITLSLQSVLPPGTSTPQPTEANPEAAAAMQTTNAGLSAVLAIDIPLINPDTTQPPPQPITPQTWTDWWSIYGWDAIPLIPPISPPFWF